MGKPTICLGENKGSGHCEADQHLCIRYTDSTIPLPFLNPKLAASSHLLYSLVYVGPGRKPKLLVFSYTGSFTFSGIPD